MATLYKLQLRNHYLDNDQIKQFVGNAREIVYHTPFLFIYIHVIEN